jgi:hypothetical protein
MELSFVWRGEAIASPLLTALLLLLARVLLPPSAATSTARRAQEEADYEHDGRDHSEDEQPMQSEAQTEQDKSQYR